MELDTVLVDDDVEGAVTLDGEMGAAVAKENGATFLGGRVVLEFAEEVAMGRHVGSGSTVDDDGDEVVGEGGILGMGASRVASGECDSASARMVTSRILIM